MGVLLLKQDCFEIIMMILIFVERVHLFYKQLSYTSGSTADRDKDSCRCHLGMPAFQNLSNVAALAVASMMQPQQPQAAPPQQTFLNPSFGATGFGTGMLSAVK